MIIVQEVERATFRQLPGNCHTQPLQGPRHGEPGLTTRAQHVAKHKKSFVLHILHDNYGMLATTMATLASHTALHIASLASAAGRMGIREAMPPFVGMTQ